MTRVKNWSRIMLVLFVLSSCIGCDQISKNVAQDALRFQSGEVLLGGTFRFIYAENPGVAFSMGDGLGATTRFWIFTVGVGGLLIVLLGITLSLRHVDRWYLAACALVLGGGFSNWLDRLLREGHVVDFMMVQVGPLRTAIFNVADVLIIVGCVLLAYKMWGVRRGGESMEGYSPGL